MRNRKIWGLATLIILISGVSVFLLTRTTETEPEKVYNPFTPAEKEQVDRNIQDAIDKSKKNLPPIAEVDRPQVEIEKTQATEKPFRDEDSAQNAENQEVRVSKFGFGPYPELPADFPWQDLFDPPYYSENPKDPHKDNPNYELMDRLWVELWKRGENVVGVGTRHSIGLFYPTIPGTIYVEWGPRWKVFGQGFGKSIRHVKGDPDDLDRLRSLRPEGESLTERDIPSDLKVLDISEGIDPYKLLNLPK